MEKTGSPGGVGPLQLFNFKEEIMRKAIKRILLALLAIIIVAVAAFAGVYFTRFQTMGSIQKLTAYADYNSIAWM